MTDWTIGNKNAPRDSKSTIPDIPIAIVIPHTPKLDVRRHGRATECKLSRGVEDLDHWRDVADKWKILERIFRISSLETVLQITAV